MSLDHLCFECSSGGNWVDELVPLSGDPAYGLFEVDGVGNPIQVCRQCAVNRVYRAEMAQCESLGCRATFGGHDENCRSFSFRVRASAIRRGESWPTVNGCERCNDRGWYTAYFFPGHGQSSERIECNHN